MMDELICNACGDTYPASVEFWLRNLKYKNGWFPYCPDCRHEMAKNRNKETKKAHNKIYKTENRERILEQYKEHYQNNKAERDAKFKEYYANNKEKFKEYRRKAKERRINNKEEII